MGTKSRRGPFQPGYGAAPPYLAGRGTEQALFRDLLEDLRNGIPAPGDVVLYGPRGNGKTVLLGWLEDAIAETPEVDAVSPTPSEIGTAGQLADLLLPRSWWEQFAPGGVSVGGVGINWRPGKEGPPRASEALSARAQRKPLVLLLDEAHTLDPEVGRALLTASQKVGRRLPFLLVLAGTPNLESHLGRMGASFWERAEQLPIGRLTEAAAAAAIRKPLEEDDITISDDALERIVADSHGYPFFVQLWGRAVWLHTSAAAPGGRRRITGVEVEAGRPSIDRRRDLFYLRRYDELKERRLLPAARSVADAFENSVLLDDAQLDAAVERGLRDEPSREEIGDARSALRHLGYIWRPGARPRWEPGIPSLMDYMRETVPAPPDP